MEETRARVNKGIKFFRSYITEDKYDSTMFKKYWPKFLDLVDECVNGKKEIEGMSVDEIESFFQKEGDELNTP